MIRLQKENARKNRELDKIRRESVKKEHFYKRKHEELKLEKDKNNLLLSKRTAAREQKRQNTGISDDAILECIQQSVVHMVKIQQIEQEFMRQSSSLEQVSVEIELEGQERAEVRLKIDRLNLKVLKLGEEDDGALLEIEQEMEQLELLIGGSNQKMDNLQCKYDYL